MTGKVVLHLTFDCFCPLFRSHRLRLSRGCRFNLLRAIRMFCTKLQGKIRNEIPQLPLVKDPFSLRNLTVPMWQRMKSIRRIKTHKQDLRKEIWPAYAQQFARTCMACENTRGFWRLFSILRPNLSFHLFFPQNSRLGQWTRKTSALRSQRAGSTLEIIHQDLM